MKKHFIARILMTVAMSMLAGYALLLSTGNQKKVSADNSERPPRPTGSEEARAWLFERRAYPTGSIPAGATERAWRDSMAAVQLSPQGLEGLEIDDHWTNIGPAPINGGQLIGATVNPRVTGRIVDIAVDPDPSQASTHWFIAADTGGIWETADGGESWTPKTEAVPSLMTNTITIAPSSPQTLFTGITDITRNGMGLLKSTDGGESWSQPLATSVFGGRKLVFITVKVHPTDPNIVLAMTYQGLEQEDAGFFKSTDGGATFPTHSLSGGGTALAINPSNFSEQYAAIRSSATNGEAPRPDLNGVFRSADMGNTWTRLSGPWDTSISSSGKPAKIAVAPSDGNTVYVVVPGGGMWKTQNAWVRTPTWGELPGALGGGTDVDVVMVDRNNPDIFYAGAGGEIPDAGTFSFQRLNPPNSGDAWTRIVSSTHVDQHALAAQGNMLLLGNDGGFWTSTDHGTTWTNKNSNLAVVQFYAGFPHPVEATASLAGSQDNGSELWSGSPAWDFKLGGDGGHSAISQLDPDSWLLSAQYLAIYRMTPAGLIFAPPPGCPTYSQSPDVCGASFIAPIKRSPDGDTVLAGSNNLWKSTDFFTASPPTWLADGPEMGAPITAIAFSARENTYAFAANDQLRLTTEGGGLETTSWTDLDPLHQVPDRVVTAMAFHPDDTSTIYVALSGYNGGTPGHIFRTTNARDEFPEWTNVGPEADVPLNALAIDPADPNTIFAGADLGVWKGVVTKDGVSWTFMGPESGMPNVPVLDLEFSPVDGHLVAYTYGRGAFKLNVGALRVNIQPAGAVDAGAEWRVDNGPYQASGTPVTGLAPGPHTVSFSPAKGFTTPANESVQISVNQITMTTTVYTEPQ
jgi:photosystem II stability/assembly factor-like uncharacterized protein